MPTPPDKSALPPSVEVHNLTTNVWRVFIGYTPHRAVTAAYIADLEDLTNLDAAVIALPPLRCGRKVIAMGDWFAEAPAAHGYAACEDRKAA